MGGEGRLVFPIHIQSVNCIACILLGKWAKSLTFKKILGIFWRMLRISHSSSNNSIVTTYCIFQLTLLFIGIVYNAYLYDASECTCSSIRVATLMMCSQCPRRTILSSSVGLILGRRWRTSCVRLCAEAYRQSIQRVHARGHSHTWWRQSHLVVAWRTVPASQN